MVLSYLNGFRLQNYISDYIERTTILDHQAYEKIEHETIKDYSIMADKFLELSPSCRVVALHLSSLVKKGGLTNGNQKSNSRGEHDAELFKNFPGRKQTLFIYNHALNITTPASAWESIDAVWKKLRPGDYLVVRELASDPIEARGLQKHSQRDGIIEFYREKRFYRTAISQSFTSFFQSRFVDAWPIFESTLHTHPTDRERSVGTHFSAFQKDPLSTRIGLSGIGNSLARHSTTRVGGKTTVEERIDNQKKKIPKRTSLLPLDGLTRKELKQVCEEGVKTIELFNEKLAQAKKNSNKD